ncbi:RAF-like serine/threonine-protein kinase PRAF [Rutidosis leptorrhynchoides]|uniref:RAF-like serine/threonine-protein kinase PRAF n=1 Tax=Rutidosis leptorrhynchoides TaxID=125765 RepID=UPI003A9A24B8
MAPEASFNTNTIKFLCSYGGKILPRYPDGKLRYHGGQTRLLSVDRSLSFSEILMKLGELYGNSVCLRCQLPTEDLDSLVSITSDEDLVNLIEEYDRHAPQSSNSIKIRAFLSLPKKSLTITSTGSGSGSGSWSSASTVTHEPVSPRSPVSFAVNYPVTAAANRCMMYHASKRQVQMPFRYGKDGEKVYGNPSRSYLVHNGNHCN